MIVVSKQRVLLLALCAFVLAVALSSECAHAQDDASSGQVALPKLLDFNKFKQIFKRSYSSLAEEIARRKLFLARAFRAFLSAIGFKHQRSTSYLAINHMSDWTPKEIQRTHLRQRLPDNVELPQHPRPLSDRGAAPKTDVVDAAVPDEDEAPVADEQDIARELEEIKRSPELADIAQELPEWQKRDEPASALELDLVREPVHESESVLNERASDKFVRMVPSNNPDYEPPELDSQAAAGDAAKTNVGTPESMTLEEASFWSRMPGGRLLQKMVGAIPKGVEMPLRPRPKQSPYDLRNPDAVHFDHRESKCFTLPRNQGDCGSCYIFSTMALYEYGYCKQTGKLAAFSEQYPLDCGKAAGMNGCDGGFEIDVAKFNKIFGFELRSKFPYREKEDICPYSFKTSAHKVGYIRLRPTNAGLRTIWREEIEEYAKHTPVLVHVGVGPNFGEYGGGVDDMAKCDEDNGHAMLLVGSGREHGKDYWLLRNSYSIRWGEQGYYKLNKARAEKCLLEEIAWVLDADADNEDAEPIKPIFKENDNYDGTQITSAYKLVHGI